MKSKILSGFAAAALVCCLGYLVFIRAETPNTVNTPESSGSPAATPHPAADPSPAPRPSQRPSPPPSILPSPEITEEPGAGIPAIDITQWQYRLVNTENPLSEDWSPDLTEVESGVLFDSRAAENMKAFIAGAREAGLTVYVSSSYRPYSVQKYLFDNKVAQYGSREAAARIVAYPGASEHQLALAADIVDRYYEFMDESLAETSLSKWLNDNCVKYGFVLRYPKDKQEVTGIMFEPWHFRYVGEEAAVFMTENGLCLEEFHDLYT